MMSSIVEIYHLKTGREANLGTIKVCLCSNNQEFFILQLVNNWICLYQQIHEDGPLRAALLLETKLTKTSTLSQVIALSAVSTRLDFETEVDWNENRKFLVSNDRLMWYRRAYAKNYWQIYYSKYFRKLNFLWISCATM